MGLNGLANINIELTSFCNKDCWICGRRERDREFGVQEYRDMPFGLLVRIAQQVPDGICVQLHNNGEPLLYRRFGDAVDLFKNQVTSIVTNGKCLVDKADEIIGKLDCLAVSVFQDDKESELQYEVLKRFLQMKGEEKPYVVARLIGNVNSKAYKQLGLRIVRRALHLPKGSLGYKRDPVIPETGFCWDIFTRLAIDTHGDVSVCVRFDPNRELVLGNLKEKTLDEMWNGKKRLGMLEKHITGRRSELNYCGSMCEYWGVPTSSK